MRIEIHLKISKYIRNGQLFNIKRRKGGSIPNKVKTTFVGSHLRFMNLKEKHIGLTMNLPEGHERQELLIYELSVLQIYMVLHQVGTKASSTSHSIWERNFTFVESLPISVFTQLNEKHYKLRRWFHDVELKRGRFLKDCLTASDGKEVIGESLDDNPLFCFNLYIH